MKPLGRSIGAVALALVASASNAAPKVASKAALPLLVVRDAPLPGKAVRFDYQALDRAHGRLIVAHMNDASVVAVNLTDESVARVVANVPVPRGVAVASEANRIFVTSSPHTLVILDATSLVELRRVRTGSAPDGVAWDPTHRIVGVSDQEDGAISLISEAGDGARTALPLGRETGNVVFDARRGWFWVAVEQARPPDELVAVDPLGPSRVRVVPLPGCAGAHGVSLHPDGATAFVACEDGAKLARVALDPGAAAPLAFAATGSGPDVLALDPALGWLYVAAESGELCVFDLARPALALVGRQALARGSHSVAVDPNTHRAYFPLAHGPSGAPVLRVMLPSTLVR
jgi:DNA-binding beta-propeller fold protein YncE